MKFILGSEKTFSDYIDSIDENDKIGILSHNDLDGMASVIFLEKILEAKGLKASFVDFLSFKIGMFSEPSEKMKKLGVAKVFLTDLNVDNSDFEGFEKFREEFDVLLIDHHPINPKLKSHKNIIKTQGSDCIAYVMYNFGKDYFDVEDWDWLICPTMIEEFSFKNNKENLDFLKKKYSDVKDYDPFDSEPGRVSREISYAVKYFKDARKIYLLLKERDLEEIKKVSKLVDGEVNKFIEVYEKEAEFYKEKNIYFYYGHPKYDVGSIVATALSKKLPSTIAFAAPSNDYMLRISFRNNSGTADVSALVKKGVEGLKNATGGGHAPAASAGIRKEDLEKFKENILN